LVRRLARELPTFFSALSHQWGLEREVTVGTSIADLVLLVDRGVKRLILGRALSVHESVVLSTLRRGERPIDFSSDSKLPIGKALRALKALGVVEEHDGTIGTTRSWQRARRVVAIEAKLFRWRDALEQAVLYRRYADGSYP
jgi:hypothetical protein